MLKKVLKVSFLFLFFLVFLVSGVKAKEEKNLYFFKSRGCPHCAREEVFLDSLAQKYPALKINAFEISESQENLALFQKVSEQFGNPGYTPFTIVGKYHFIGFLDEQTTGREIEEAVECFLADGCEDLVGKIIEPQSSPNQKIPETLNLPFIGEVGIKNLSLPALTFLIALLDGFNPCAMWVLLFLISLLLGMEDKKKMWVLGTTFIIASAVVYFLFMSAWLNLFLFLGFVLWVRIIVSLAALFAGGYNLRDYWLNKDGGCQTVGEVKREKVFNWLKEVTRKKDFFLALGGMVVLAFVVNLIELVCSAGLPAIYTQILALADLPRWQHYAYLLFYIFIFMLDDLFVFVVAMVTLQAAGIQTKYVRYSRLIGGILMLMIGVLLLFKPEWLMFG